MCCKPERGDFAEEYPSAHANIQALERQLAEAQRRLKRVEEVTEKHLEGCPSAPCTLPQEIARILKEGK